MLGPDDRNWVTIGRVTAPQGLRGEVRVFPLTDVEGRFEQVDRVFAQSIARKGRRPLHIERVGYRKNLVILGFREITDIDQAEALRDALLQVPIDEVAPLPKGTYYVFQLIGLAVDTVDGVHVGRVAEVLTDNLPNDIYVVEREGQEPALIPAVRQFVREVDLSGGRIIIDPIPGLL